MYLSPLPLARSLPPGGGAAYFYLSPYVYFAGANLTANQAPSVGGNGKGGAIYM